MNQTFAEKVEERNKELGQPTRVEQATISDATPRAGLFRQHSWQAVLQVTSYKLQVTSYKF